MVLSYTYAHTVSSAAFFAINGLIRQKQTFRIAVTAQPIIPFFSSTFAI